VLCWYLVSHSSPSARMSCCVFYNACTTCCRWPGRLAVSLCQRVPSCLSSYVVTFSRVYYSLLVSFRCEPLRLSWKQAAALQLRSPICVSSVVRLIVRRIVRVHVHVDTRSIRCLHGAIYSTAAGLRKSRLGTVPWPCQGRTSIMACLRALSDVVSCPLPGSKCRRRRRIRMAIMIKLRLVFHCGYCRSVTGGGIPRIPFTFRARLSESAHSLAAWVGHCCSQVRLNSLRSLAGRDRLRVGIREFA